MTSVTRSIALQYRNYEVMPVNARPYAIEENHMLARENTESYLRIFLSGIGTFISAKYDSCFYWCICFIMFTFVLRLVPEIRRVS